MNYIFHGLCGYDDNEYDFCISATSLDNAWERVAIYYAEFTNVTFVRVEKEEM